MDIEKEKRVIIKMPGKNHAEFKIQLNYDSLTQTAFFRAMMEGYVSQDELIVGYIEKYKKQNGKHSRHRKKTIQQNIDNRSSTNRSFSLDKEELSDLYDLVEKEYPEL
tara:strand:- start:372 stop:695 length:324 start_codon:yes stop_codon:yes gene_type:complete